MDKIEKQLLLKDLCGRLPYDVEAQVANNIVGESKPLIINKPLTFEDVNSFVGNGVVIDIKPYLRPMSSMTEEEKKVVCSMNMISDTELNDRLNYQRMYVQNYTIETFDYFNERKLDYRGLIEKGLAIEAPEDMYKQ